MIENPKTGVTVDESTLPDANVSELIALCRRDWKNPYFGAVPYIDALSQVEHIDDQYIAETGRQMVPYFLNNASTWRGPIAKAVKAELKRRLKA